MTEDIRIVSQCLVHCALGQVRRAAYITNSRGLRPDLMRVLGSYALVYVLDGSGSYRDANGVDRPVGAGDLMRLFPDVGHTYGPRKGATWSEFYILFEGPAFDLWRQTGLLDPAQPVVHMEPVSYWQRRLESAVEAPRTPEGPHPVAAVARLQQLLADIFVHVTESRLGGDEREWLTRACDLLDRPAAAEDVDWEEIAGKLHMSYENFRKRFARLAGMPPSQYRMRRIMERASELMHRSYMTLREVADECGFCNEFHFSRRFKQIVGLSPKEYRKQLPR
jgi:AraC-like DNA-binding protein